MHRAALALTLGLALSSAGCEVTGTFACAGSEACRRGAEMGVCEAEGFCSFADPACTPTGRRFDDFAGELAGVCVGEAPRASCLASWKAHAPHLAAIAPLAINSPMDDRDPWLSPAETLLLFSSNRTGSQSYDIWQATRASTQAAWGTPVRQAAMSSSAADTHVSLTADGLTVFLASERSGTSDVWRASRPAPGQPLSAFDRTHLDNIDTQAAERDAAVSRDGLHLYFSSSLEQGQQRIAVAARPSATVAFGAPAAIDLLAGAANDADPSVSGDELVLVFTSTRTAAAKGANILYATRAAITEPWGMPELVPDINTDADEGDPHLSPDGCTLLFARAATTSSGSTYDLYAVQVGE